MNELLPFPQIRVLLSDCGFRNRLRFLDHGVRKSRTLHARSGQAVEGIVSSRHRSQNAQGNLSHRQKRHFLITEKGSPVTLNASLSGMVFDPVSDRRIHCLPLNL